MNDPLTSLGQAPIQPQSGQPKAPDFGPRLNVRAVKRLAMRTSAEQRSGKFTQVSQDFVNEIEATLETALRKLCNFHSGSQVYDYLDGHGEWFLNNAMEKHVLEVVNTAVCQAIQRRVHQNRTGKTLT